MANDYKDRFIQKKQDNPIERREQTNIAPDWQILSPSLQGKYGILPKTLPQIVSSEEDRKESAHIRYLRSKTKKDKKHEQKFEEESNTEIQYEGNEETIE